MNNMEDKELQELFAAKRTTEANRRRQEELRRLIEAQAAPRTRRLWPVWSGAAAAAVALLLLARPLLQPTAEGTAPTLVAQAEVPAPGESPTPTEEPISPIDPISPIRPISPTGPIGPISPTSPISPVSHTDTAPTPLPEPEASPVIEEPAAPVEAEQQTVAPEHRVMRRQSTLLACTEGCKAPEGNDEAKPGNVQVNLFSNEQYADATIHTFVISK